MWQGSACFRPVRCDARYEGPINSGRGGGGACAQPSLTDICGALQRLWGRMAGCVRRGHGRRAGPRPRSDTPVASTAGSQRGRPTEGSSAMFVALGQLPRISRNHKVDRPRGGRTQTRARQTRAPECPRQGPSPSAMLSPALATDGGGRGRAATHARPMLGLRAALAQRIYTRRPRTLCIAPVCRLVRADSCLLSWSFWGVGACRSGAFTCALLRQVACRLQPLLRRPLPDSGSMHETVDRAATLALLCVCVQSTLWLLLFRRGHPGPNRCYRTTGESRPERGEIGATVVDVRPNQNLTTKSGRAPRKLQSPTRVLEFRAGRLRFGPAVGESP